jgi:hypothetical protein
MGKVVLSEHISLDGIIEDPARTMPYWSDEIAKFKYEELFSYDADLEGHRPFK